MCGRFNNNITKLDGWSLGDMPSVRSNYNVAPSTQIAAFKGNKGDVMRWGMIPSWSKTFDSKYATFNARIETVAEKPSFRSAWSKSQRCLMPMAGYYEWKGDKGSKQPFYVTDRDAGGLVVAGLYELWGDDNQLSCTILTKPASKELEHLHPRIPIMLNPDSAHEWVSGDLDKDNLIGLEVPNVIYYPVSKEVGNVKNNHKGLIKPTDILNTSQ